LKRLGKEEQSEVDDFTYAVNNLRISSIFHVWFPSLISVNLALAVLKKIIYMDIYFFLSSKR
jgi:hypothetical protein